MPSLWAQTMPQLVSEGAVPGHGLWELCLARDSTLHAPSPLAAEQRRGFAGPGTGSPSSAPSLMLQSRAPCAWVSPGVAPSVCTAPCLCSWHPGMGRSQAAPAWCMAWEACAPPRDLCVCKCVISRPSLSWKSRLGKGPPCHCGETSVPAHPSSTLHVTWLASSPGTAVPGTEMHLPAVPWQAQAVGMAVAFPCQHTWHRRGWLDGLGCRLWSPTGLEAGLTPVPCAVALGPRRPPLSPLLLSRPVLVNPGC